MYALGVDPGLRNTGFCLIGPGDRVEVRGVIVPPGSGYLQPHEVLNEVLPRLADVLDLHKVEVAGVEQVAWYGSAKRITLPLSHVSGGIAGFLVGRGVATCLLLANMRPKLPRRKSWTEHENDAYELAIAAKAAFDVSRVVGSGGRRKLSAAAARTITVPESAHGAGT